MLERSSSSRNCAPTCCQYVEEDATNRFGNDTANGIGDDIDQGKDTIDKASENTKQGEDKANKVDNNVD